MTVDTMTEGHSPIDSVRIMDSKKDDRSKATLGAYLHSLKWPGITFAVMLAVTAYAYYITAKKGEAAAQIEFDFRKAELIEAIERRLVAYTQTLYGGLGLFNASDKVSRGEWRAYVKTLKIDSVFPGIQGLGYSEFVDPINKAEYENAVRQEGFPDFAIRPPGQRSLFSSITYLEPFDKRNQQAFGYDMYSQETRRTAMDLARDSGQVAISGKVTLVQEITDDVQAGFLIYVPYYGAGEEPTSVEERQRRIRGYVYSPFRMGDLMSGILGHGTPDLNLKIFDSHIASNETLMYEAGTERAFSPPLFNDRISFDFGQHEWTLAIASEPSFEAKHASTDANIILIAGIVTSLLVFGVQWSFASTGRRAQNLAEKMTESLEERSIELAQSNQELARSNAELERFAYAASHDLRSPLRAIGSLAGWLEEDMEGNISEECREHLTTMRSRIQRLETLLDGLLQYSRIGRVSYDVQQIDANTLVREIVDLTHLPEGISVTIADGLPVFNAAVSPLTQVLQNLISNAAKHHDRATGSIEIKGQDLGSHVSFSVTDDGPGIPEEYAEKIFEMFETLKRRDEIEGSGMGLAIVKRQVHEHGGTIALQGTDKERGAEFHFTWQKLHSSEGFENEN